MKRKEPVITVDDLRAAMQEAYKDSGGSNSQIPAGHFTLAEFAQKMKLTTGEAQSRLDRNVAENGWKRTRLLGKTLGGRMMRQWYYFKSKT